ncbi:WD40 repeat-like protein [Agrocybe pediades]|nr:WD40 repeat-like protein [Agrocybe pediades]
MPPRDPLSKNAEPLGPELGCSHCPHEDGARNLVLHFDGTENKFGDEKTNVAEMYKLVHVREDEGKLEQLKVYFGSGIGTYARPSWSAYELYADNKSGEKDETSESTSKAGRFKSAFCHMDVKVHFVGVWDTVSSIGIVRGKKPLPGTSEGMGHVCFFRHALALDERRVRFLPEYAYGSSTLPPNRQGSSVAMEPSSTGAGEKAPARENNSEADGQPSTTAENLVQFVTKTRPQCLEVWFAGTHSDIGGVNTRNEGMDLSRPPLRWMIHEAGSFGLLTKPFTHELISREYIEIKDSLSGIWKVLEWLPVKRLTYDNMGRNPKEHTRRPHRGADRIIHPGQKIHVSGMPSGYYPKARLASEVYGASEFWQNIASGKLSDEWLVVDLEQQVEDLLRVYISERETETQKEQMLNALKQIPTWIGGRQALYDACIKLLRTTGAYTKLENVTDQKPAQKPLDNDKSHRLLELVETILPKSRLDNVRLTPFRDLRESLATLLEDGAQQDTVFKCLVHLTDFVDSVLQATSRPQSIAFSANGNRLASGHEDGTVMIWNLTKGSQTSGKALDHHAPRSGVACVAFSPDSQHIVSGSRDNSIRLWDVEKLEQVGDPWKGHTGEINCVAFSPDGTKVVSGSDDKTLRLWDPETGNEIAVLTGHLNWVLSAVFSPDGLHIASGSIDHTVRIWDAWTCQQDGEPLKGHTDYVYSVAYSPDGTQIASGSWDRTIRIWNATTRMQVGHPLQGHSHFIRSICFSPNGKLIASGSGDSSIRIWNAATGAQIGEGLRGHDAYVWSVAFSPDGKRLASASFDRTIRIWDVESYVKLSLFSIS